MIASMADPCLALHLIEMEITETDQDEYIREGLDLKKEKGYDIHESSWEEFEKTIIKIKKQ